MDSRPAESLVNQPLFKYVGLDRLESVIADSFAPLGSEPVRVRESVRRVLAEDVKSPVDLPGHDISHVDGFAISECDDRTYRIVRGEVLGRCEAAYVETGKPVPEGAVAVVPVESARLLEGGLVAAPRSYERFHEIIRRGSDVAGGRLVASRGQVVTPSIARLLLELGVEEVRVYRRPRTLLVPTGTEFVEGSKRESSSVLVKAMCEAVGALVDVSEPVEDSAETMKRVLEESLGRYDAVATIGGASLGRGDYVLAAALELPGSEILARGLAVQPGRVTTLARVGRKPLALLPGLIQSTVVGTVLALQPLLRRLQGATPRAHYPVGLYRLASSYRYSGRFASFARVRFAKLVGDFEVELVEAASPIQSVVAFSHGFVLLKPGEVELVEGTYVPLYRAPGLYPEGP